MPSLSANRKKKFRAARGTGNDADWKPPARLIDWRSAAIRPAGPVDPDRQTVQRRTVKTKKSDKKMAPPPVYVVSGGSGESGRQVVETALAQFPTLALPIVVRSRVRSVRQLEAAAAEAKARGGVVVHTLVQGELREALVRFCRTRGVATIDLMGPLLDQVEKRTGARPIQQPGRYRKLRRDYFNRVEAIEFAVAHDDGNHPEDLPDADIIVVGVSRCGKTPLSMYLGVHGWKVANVPILGDLPPAQQLFRGDRRRVIGLSIEYKNLLEHRKKRRELLGRVGPTPYSSPSTVFAEVEAARSFYRAGGFSVVDVTDKSIEVIADEIIRIVSPTRTGTHRRRVPT